MNSIGLKYPLIPNNKGNFETISSTSTMVDQNISNFLQSSKNTRPMNRSLGLNLRKYLGEFMNEELKSIVSDRIQDNLENVFYDNIKNVNVDINQNNSEHMLIKVEYFNRSDMVNYEKRVVLIEFK